MSNEYYLSEDGVIHRKGSRHTSFAYAGSGQTSFLHRAIYWLITTAVAVLIAFVGYRYGAYRIPLENSDFREMFAFFRMAIPYAMIAGAVIGNTVYGTTCAFIRDYDVSAGFYAALSAALGAVCGMGAACVIPFLVIALLYVFAFAIILCIIFTILANL